VLTITGGNQPNFRGITEAFFEKPRQLKTNHPDLYEEMKYFYKVDPAEWYQQMSE
jgi:Mlc titration factor MtfA (ptsG expression regulator)